MDSGTTVYNLVVSGGKLRKVLSMESRTQNLKIGKECM